MKWIATLCLTAGCVHSGEEALPAPDFDAFSTQVQPILAARCGNPTCHGDPARPWMLYSPFQHRIDVTQVHLDTPLTAEELDRNYQRTLGFLSGGSRALMLTKPLDIAAGGAGHKGGPQFFERSEPEFQVLLRWVDEAVTPRERPRASSDFWPRCWSAAGHSAWLTGYS